MRILKIFGLGIFFAIVLGIGACGPSVPLYDSPQFSPEKMEFFNSNGVDSRKSFGELFDLAKAYWTRPKDEYEETGFSLVKQDRTRLQQLDDEVIWVGHSTVLLRHQGITVMTDPMFSERASPVSFAGPKRATALPFELVDLPSIDAVVISHSHYDHLDKPSIVTLAALQPDLRFYVPLGLKPVLRGWGVENVEELDWWQEIKLGPARIVATPTQHWSARKPFNRNKTLWAGWMVIWDDFKFYFAGDTGYADYFNETRERLGAVDLAAIPIGAYEPRYFMEASHVNPADAVQIFQDLGAKKAIAIHWGTFKLTLESLAEPPIKLHESLNASNLTEDDFNILQHGEITSIWR